MNPHDEMLSLYVMNELAAAERAEFEKRLAASPALRAEAQRLRDAAQWYKTQAQAPAATLSARGRELIEQAARVRPRVVARRSMSHYLALFTSVAAALLLTVLALTGRKPQFAEQPGYSFADFEELRRAYPHLVGGELEKLAKQQQNFKHLQRNLQAPTHSGYWGDPGKTDGIYFADATMSLEPATVAHVWATAIPGADDPQDCRETIDYEAGNTYRSYPVNPFVAAYKDNLSTFAVDTDTAAYTLARAQLLQQQLPDPAGIRIEEFVNYFKQDYPAPQRRAFNLFTDCAPSPFGKGCYLLRVGVQGRKRPAAERKDFNLTFVVDLSGSMEDYNRIETAKEGLRYLVSQLRATDKIAIVGFGDSASVRLQPTPVSEGQTILEAVDALRCDGSTNLEDGIRAGYALAEQHFERGRVNRIILCSDGEANLGNVTPEAILLGVAAKRAAGITLTCLGFGMGNYNDALMEQLADQGDGFCAYVDSMREVKRLFAGGNLDVLEVIAKDAKIQVDFNPAAVKEYRLIGYENRAVADRDFRNDDIDAGEICAGHTVTALYELKLDEEYADAVQLAMVQLRFRDAATDVVEEIRTEMETDKVQGDFAGTDARFRLAAAAAEFAERLRKSEFAVDGDWGALAQLATQAADELADDVDAQELPDLIDLARNLLSTLPEDTFEKDK